MFAKLFPWFKWLLIHKDKPKKKIITEIVLQSRSLTCFPYPHGRMTIIINTAPFLIYIIPTSLTIQSTSTITHHSPLFLKMTKWGTPSFLINLILMLSLALVTLANNNGDFHYFYFVQQVFFFWNYFLESRSWVPFDFSFLFDYRIISIRLLMMKWKMCSG